MPNFYIRNIFPQGHIWYSQERKYCIQSGGPCKWDLYQFWVQVDFLCEEGSWVDSERQIALVSIPLLYVAGFEVFISHVPGLLFFLHHHKIVVTLFGSHKYKIFLVITYLHPDSLTRRVRFKIDKNIFIGLIDTHTDHLRGIQQAVYTTKYSLWYRIK